MTAVPNANPEAQDMQHLVSGVSAVGWWLWTLHKIESSQGGPVEWATAGAVRMAIVNQMCNLLEEQSRPPTPTVVSLRTLQIQNDAAVKAAALRLFRGEGPRIVALREYRHKIVAHSDERVVRKRRPEPLEPSFDDLCALYDAMIGFIYAKYKAVGVYHAFLLDPRDASICLSEPMDPTPPTPSP